MWKRFVEKLKSFWSENSAIIILVICILNVLAIFSGCHSVVDIHDLENGSFVSGVDTEVDVL